VARPNRMHSGRERGSQCELGSRKMVNFDPKLVTFFLHYSPPASPSSPLSSTTRLTSTNQPTNHRETLQSCVFSPLQQRQAFVPSVLLSFAWAPCLLAFAAVFTKPLLISRFDDTCGDTEVRQRNTTALLTYTILLHPLLGFRVTSWCK
jgi:hypothetical protein